MLELPIALLFGGQSLLLFFGGGKGGGGGGVDFSISTPKVIIKVFCEVMLFECSRAKLYNSSQNDHLFFYMYLGYTSGKSLQLVAYSILLC